MNRSLMRFAPYLAFFLSGGSSLIFQTIWTRMLHHVFGATSVAISTVLTAFMAGLGLGNYLAGRYANRIKHPIFAYAFAEAGVALWGLLIPFLVTSDGWLGSVNAFMRQSLGAESSTFMIVRFLCVAPLILVPTTLMGASFPLLTRHFVTANENAESASGKVGILYALNTFGAATGPVLSAFVLLPNVGLMWTNLIACAMNLSLFGVIMFLRKDLIGSDWGSGVKIAFWPGKEDVAVETGNTHEPAREPAVERPAERAESAAVETKEVPKKKGKKSKAAPPASGDVRVEASKPEKATKPGSDDENVWVPKVARHMAFVSFAASGAAALCYEVVWSRALAMCIGSSIYSFALILETFLIGIASGAAAMSAFMGKKKRPLLGVGIAAGVMTFLATVPMAVAHGSDGENRSGDIVSWLVMSAFGAALVIAIGIYASRRAAVMQEFDAKADDVSPAALTMLAVPLAYAVFTAFQFDGYLPKIIASVVTSVVVFIGIMVVLGRSPVLLVAVMQLYIGLATVVSYVWQDEIPYAFAQLVVSIENLPDHVGLVQFFMFLTAMLCTLPATLGMGAMFPLTVRVWTLGGEGVARDVGQVYTGNTIGSIVGAWLPGFILMPWIGIEMTLQVGIWLNLLLALGMLIAGAAEPEEHPRLPSPKLGEKLFRAAAAAFVLSVVALVAMHQAWAGLILIPLGLIAFWRKAPSYAAWSTGATALAVLIASLAEAQHGGSVAWLSGILGLEDSPRLAMMLAMVPRVLLAVGMLSATWILATSEDIEAFVAGTPEPDAQPARTEPKEGESKEGDAKKGELPLWHAITVYVLAPAIPALLALLWLGTHTENALLRWNPTQMTLGVFRVSLASGMLDPESWGQPELVFYQDGLSTTVTVERWGRHYALKNNGKVDASNGDDMPTQITVAAYPLLMHPAGPTDLDVAVVGFGSGVTVGTAMSFPVRSVDVIELERAIPEAARWFSDVNLLDYNLDHYPFIEMDRLEIIADDGRNYLASTDRMYDVIISEPSNPWITGVSDLFTVDHFRVARRRLREGGIYCQWVQLYEMSPENIKVIFRTFAEVFPHVLVLAADDRSSDTVVLGSDSPLNMDLERFQRVWALGDAVEGRMSVPDQLARAYLRTPYDVFARVLLSDRDEVMSYTQIEERLREDTWIEDLASTNIGDCDAADCRRSSVAVNTDDNAHIEFAAPRDLIGFERYESYLSTVYSPEWPYGRLEQILSGFGEGDALSRNYAELALALIAHGRYDVAAHFIDLSQQAGETRETAVALEVLTHLLSTEHEPPIRVEPPRPGPEMDRETAAQLVEGFDAVRDAVDRSDYRAALEAMEDIPSPLRLHSGPGMRFLYGYLLYKAADGALAQYRASSETLSDLARNDEDYSAAHPELFYYLARAQDAEGEYDEAMLQMRRYIEARLTRTGADLTDTPEPPVSEAPTSNVPGESDKTEHEH